MYEPKNHTLIKWFIKSVVQPLNATVDSAATLLLQYSVRDEHVLIQRGLLNGSILLLIWLVGGGDSAGYVLATFVIEQQNDDRIYFKLCCD